MAAGAGTRARGRGRSRWGHYGKHIELFELFESWADDPAAQTALAEEEGFDIEEGTGAPEGRADFPLFLLSVTRHKMREGFRRRAAQWDRYVGVERAEDFRQHTVSQLNGLSGMGPVPEFDEYPMIRSSEEMGPPFSVGKHGGLYGVTFEMIVNDETNKILNRTPTELGRMSAAYVSQVVVGLIETNANWIDGLPFFTATARQGLPTGNEFTGSAAEPTEDNLISIVASLQNTVDSEGMPIDIEPGVIITKDERTRYIFRRILRSQQTGTVTNDSAGDVFDKGTYNAAQDTGLTPDDIIVEQYMRDPNDWILLANTGRPAFIIAFLRDMREPFIGIEEGSVRSFGGGVRDPYRTRIDEIRMKIRHVFGVALGDPRSARRARRA
jgi:hypothetical protein